MLDSAEVRNQTAIDRHQIGAYWSAESTGVQGLTGTTAGDYFNNTSRLSKQSELRTSVA